MCSPAALFGYSFIHSYSMMSCLHRQKILPVTPWIVTLLDRTSTERRLASVVGRRLSGRALGRDVALGHAAIDNEIRAVDEARLVAGEENNSLGLLDGLTEAASGEVNLTTVALGLVITEPVLEERSAVFVRRRMIRYDKKTHLRGAGHRALKRYPSLAWHMANSLVSAKTAPLLAVYAS